ncbi:TetR/AcrR family transcriptional regulator [uncultured Methanobrevibacter sp.]|uniref:TetR/AcrR family transcriptional regulator n=1 Tax=uncultured Methanobrevibacter sp. TaxID=253161 RepID=UPI0025F00CA6|nr:TetR/AcrR family transcriptional regulator [uncultured Methanobrevibacter sp.]
MEAEIDKTSEKIIQATLVILQENGFDKATTKKIAAEAGVNELTIFRKFKNKKNLVDATKEYYLQILIDKLNEIFEFDEDESIDVFLKISFFGILSLEDSDFSILKVAMEEVRNDEEDEPLISKITDLILNKLEEFFKLQIDKGVIKEINTRSISVMCYSSLFQSVILWKIYNKSLGFETNDYIDDLLNIFLEGIMI